MDISHILNVHISIKTFSSRRGDRGNMRAISCQLLLDGQGRRKRTERDTQHSWGGRDTRHPLSELAERCPSVPPLASFSSFNHLQLKAPFNLSKVQDSKKMLAKLKWADILLSYLSATSTLCGCCWFKSRCNSLFTTESSEVVHQQAKGAGWCLCLSRPLIRLYPASY